MTSANDTLGKGLDLVEVASGLLTNVEEHFAAAAVDLPVRRYLVPGDPAQAAWDCEQVTVSMQGVGWGPVPDLASQSPKIGIHASVASVRHVVLVVEIVRCTPSVQQSRSGNTLLPSVEDMDESGRASMRDAGLLSQAIVRYASRVRQIIDKESGLVQPGAVQPVGPAGGFVSNAGTLAISAGNLL